MAFPFRFPALYRAFGLARLGSGVGHRVLVDLPVVPRGKQAIPSKSYSADLVLGVMSVLVLVFVFVLVLTAHQERSRKQERGARSKDKCHQREEGVGSDHSMFFAKFPVSAAAVSQPSDGLCGKYVGDAIAKR